jgi:hypothetical protein
VRAAQYVVGVIILALVGFIGWCIGQLILRVLP